MNNSARRTLEVLELLASSDEALTVSEIAKSLCIPKSSAFDLVSVLLEKNYIHLHNTKAKTYSLGFSTYRIGMAYINRADLYAAVHPLLVELSEKYRQTFYLAVEDNGEIVYLDKVESDAPIRSICRIGSKNLMHLTGLGKAILSGYSEQKVRSIIKEPLEIRTENTIRSVDELLKETETIRQRGYAIDIKEDNQMVCCVAAPIRGADGSVIAAMSASLLSADDTTLQTLEMLAKPICAAALEASKRMGYTGFALYE